MQLDILASIQDRREHDSRGDVLSVNIFDERRHILAKGQIPHRFLTVAGIR
jgi:hypothetical protein